MAQMEVPVVAQHQAQVEQVDLVVAEGAAKAVALAAQVALAVVALLFFAGTFKRKINELRTY
jgi:hypothetical protein